MNTLIRSDDLTELARSVGAVDLERAASLFAETLTHAIEEWAVLARITPAQLLADIFAAISPDLDHFEAAVQTGQAEARSAAPAIDLDEVCQHFQLLADDYLGQVLFHSDDNEARALALLVHINWAVVNLAISRQQTFAAAWQQEIAAAAV